MENIFKSNYSSPSTDDPLVSQAVGGSHKAVEKLIQRHQKWIYNIALRMVGEPYDAEDVTQEVLIKIIKNLPGFKQESSFRTWAYRIVVNHVLNMKKRDPEKKWTSLDHYSKATDNTPDMDFPDQKSLPVEKSLIIEEIKIHCMMGMLLCLNRKERLVFIFGEIFEFSSSVSCDILGFSNDNFRQILSRARRKVYNFMKGKCGLIDKKNSCHCDRKAKAMIDSGDIDPRNLYFIRNSLFKLNTLMEKKYCRLDDLVESQCRKLFREQPFFDSPDFVQSFREMLKSSEFKDIFNLN
jgi:RNA polymerase sigma factor (sigma-70 family)